MCRKCSTLLALSAFVSISAYTTVPFQQIHQHSLRRIASSLSSHSNDNSYPEEDMIWKDSLFRPPILPYDYYSVTSNPSSSSLPSSSSCEDEICLKGKVLPAQDSKYIDFKVEMPSVIPFGDSDFTVEVDEKLLLSSSSKNLQKGKTLIPSDRILLMRDEPDDSLKPEGHHEKEELEEARYGSIFEAMQNRDHGAILKMIEDDVRQLEKHDFSCYDVPFGSIPLIVAINLGLPIQLIKILIEKTPRRSLGRQNDEGATALSMSIVKRMPREVILSLIERTPADSFDSQGDYQESILTVAILSKLPSDLVVAILDKCSSSEVTHALLLHAIQLETPLPLLQLMISKADVEEIRQAVRIAMHKNNMNAESMCMLVEADLPIQARTTSRGYSSWHMLISHPGDANFEAIKLLLRRNAEIVGQLAVSEDADGRISFGMASKRVRDEMSKYL